MKNLIVTLSHSRRPRHAALTPLKLAALLAIVVSLLGSGCSTVPAQPQGTSTAKPQPTQEPPQNSPVTPQKSPEAPPVARMPEAPLQSIRFSPLVTPADTELITMGLPLPPGLLFDPQNVRILDSDGNETPAFVRPTLTWHFRDDSIRAVKVQFFVAKADLDSTFSFDLENPRTRFIDEQSVADGQALIEDISMPRVSSLLSPQWMSNSAIAGPQVATEFNHPQRRFFRTQYEWARLSPFEQGNIWLYDRPSTILKEYVRTGELAYLEEGLKSYQFYISKIDPTGKPGWPRCGGGWVHDRVKKCDSKFVYIEPIVVYIGLTGDDAILETDTIDAMVGAWTTNGWAEYSGPYLELRQTFTERRAGLGLLATVAAFELTARDEYLTLIKNRVGWLFDHQQNNPDGLGIDGSWRHSWQLHEGDSYNARTDPRGGSPWMSENIIDGLWHAWQVFPDPKISQMIVEFGRFMENWGWATKEAFQIAGHSWRRKCSGSDGQIPWYWSSSTVPLETLIKIQDSEGWFSDAHTVEMVMPVSAAYYFAEDADLKRALKDRLNKMRSSFADRCARNSTTDRKFNWNHRSFSSYLWQAAFSSD